MKEKYNRMVDQSKNKEFINSLKEQNEMELVDFYKDLRKINPSKTFIGHQ